MSVGHDPVTAFLLAFVCLLVGIAIIAVALRSDALLMTARADPEPEKLDDEITSLERRLGELEANQNPPTWQTTALIWRAQRRLAGLKQRRRRFEESARRWEARAKAVCLPESLPRRPNAVQSPSVNGKVQS